MNRPSKEQVINLHNELQKERDSIPEYSSFGDNNWQPLEDSIYMLEKATHGIFDLEDPNYENMVYDVWCWLEDKVNDDIYSDYCEEL